MRYFSDKNGLLRSIYRIYKVHFGLDIAFLKQDIQQRFLDADKENGVLCHSHCNNIAKYQQGAYKRDDSNRFGGLPFQGDSTEDDISITPKFWRSTKVVLGEINLL